MRPFAALLLLLPALGLSGCGPTDEEVGRAILLIALVPHALGIGLMYLFFRLYKHLKRGVSLDLKPMLIALGLLVVAAGLSLVGVTEKEPDLPDASGVEGVLEWAGTALWAFGTSYLAVWLVLMRIWLAKSPRTAFSWSFLPVLLFMIWPCPVMAAGLTRTWQEVFNYIWIYAGYLGYVTGPVLILLLIEAWIRYRRAHAPPKRMSFTEESGEEN